jgi:hypothetical protein
MLGLAVLAALGVSGWLLWMRRRAVEVVDTVAPDPFGDALVRDRPLAPASPPAVPQPG